MWPELPYHRWENTKNTLHMWMQIVGKVKLALSPFENQWWEVAFYITPTGISTGIIPYKDITFQVHFNFLESELSITTDSGKLAIITLRPYSVREFYAEFMQALNGLGIFVTIWPVPVEVQNPIPFNKDTKHASYDKEFVEKWWHVLVKTTNIFEQFRTNFRGKNSPIHFFWGSFDLNQTRFSGKRAKPPQLKGVIGKIMHFAENEENFATGFWPGDERFPNAAFYSYMYPKPSGMESLPLTRGASFNEQLEECILPYDTVQKAQDPEAEILHFLNSTYRESTKLTKWNRKDLQAELPNTNF